MGKATAEIEAAQRLKNLPATAAAQREGKVSPEQAAAVADASSVDPSAEGRLLDDAQRTSLGELRDECARVKAAADRDREATRKRIHAGRGCRRRTTAEGGGEITYPSTLEDSNEIWAVISGYANTQFDKARLAGRHESEEAYTADGLLAMARAAAAAEPTRVVSRAGKPRDSGRNMGSGPPIRRCRPGSRWAHGGGDKTIRSWLRCSPKAKTSSQSLIWAANPGPTSSPPCNGHNQCAPA